MNPDNIKIKDGLHDPDHYLLATTRTMGDKVLFLCECGAYIWVEPTKDLAL